MSEPYYIKKITDYLPLQLIEVSWERGCFSIFGKGWVFSTSSAWRISSEDRIEYGSEDDVKDEQLEKLINAKILSVHPTGFNNFDLQFVLDNELVIEFFSATYFEAWEVRLPDETIIVSDGSAG